MPRSSFQKLAVLIVLTSLLCAEGLVAGPPAAPASQPAAVAVPEVSLCGCKSAGNNVVFVCDATGSIMKSFDLLRVELRKTVDKLTSRQNFGIVFFQEDAKPPLERTLIPATNENKRRASEFLDNYAARGPTDPMPALELALSMKPDVLYFLISPSCFPDKPAVVELFREARKLNPALIINTIAWIDRDPKDEEFLKQVATEGGGKFVVVTEDDLAK